MKPKRYNTLTRLAKTATQPLRRAVLKRRLGRVVLEEVEGIPVVVTPEVFNPAVFRSSSVLVRALRQRANTPRATKERALDMGTGTGVGAIAAARLGYSVVAVDINPEAVRCARLNAMLNRVENAVDVRDGDLFEPVLNQRFDVVLFNPPFFDGAPGSALDRAWRSLDVPERFAAGVASALAPNGCALVLVSSHGGRDRTTVALIKAGLIVTPGFVADLGDEIFTVLEARRPEAR